MAVEECRNAGGGTVIIPHGTYLTGSIRLYSDITIYFENSAIPKSTANPEDFDYIGFMHQ